MSHNPIQGRIVPRSLIQLGAEVLGSQSRFKTWLHEPAFGFNNQKPIDIINNEPGGVQRVHDLLMAIQHGCT